MGSNRVSGPLLKRAGFLNTRKANVLQQKRLKGIEPSSQAWEAGVLPLHHSRKITGSPVFHQCILGLSALQCLAMNGVNSDPFLPRSGEKW